MNGECFLLLMLGNRNFFWYTKNISTACTVSYFIEIDVELRCNIYHFIWTPITYPGQQRNATSIINQIYEIIILRFREVAYIKCTIVFFSCPKFFFFLSSIQMHLRILKNFTRPIFKNIFNMFCIFNFSFFIEWNVSRNIPILYNLWARYCSCSTVNVRVSKCADVRTLTN